MIWKAKGPAEILKNNRFLHLKSYLPRACEALVVGRMKKDILAASSPYQVGGQPGHSADENIIVIKSLMALTEKTGKGFIFNSVDIVGFFDNEQIIDVMDCLDSVGVSRKASKCWYKLNQNTRIKVNTACGMTDTAEAGDLVGQGTAGAGLVSQLNLDMGMQSFFSSSSDEMHYGRVRVEYTAYQDDVGKPSGSVKEANVHMVKMAKMLKDKGLEAHPSKTGYILFKGSKKDKEQMEKELLLMPLVFGEFKMKRKTQDKYLGHILHEDGLTASVAATVKDRTGRFKGATFEVRSIIEDFAMQTLGGMEVAKILLERALLPSLLYGASSWLGIDKRTEDQ